MIPGPICLNCEKKKAAPYPITLDQKSGYICEECYKAHIWAANELGISTKTEKELHLCLIPKDIQGEKEGSQNSIPILRLV